MLDLPQWPFHSDDEILAVQQVLNSGKVNQWTGEEVKLFQQEYAAWFGVKHAVAVANGTVALELALQALSIGHGDEVIVPSHTFWATASCVLMRGATPVVADVEFDSNTVSAETLEKVLGPKTKAIIVVHLAGWPCNMGPIVELVKKENLYLIEDCAQAHGAVYNNQKVGTFGDIAAFSFCTDKIMSTGGEGGMVLTNDEALFKQMWSFKDHGRDYELVFNTNHPPGFRWFHTQVGTNLRMTEMQASIGRKQLAKLTDWLRARERNADILEKYFKQILAFRVPERPENIQHANYKYYTYIVKERLKSNWDRDRIMVELNKKGIPCIVGGCSEIYREKAFAKMAPSERLPNAKLLGETSLVFPVYPTLSPEHIQQMSEIISDVMREATNLDE